MARDLHDDARVIELGPGTGTVTQAIVDNGVRGCNLCLVERHDQFIELLRARFPEAVTINADARRLGEHLASWSGTVDFIVSGLPLMLFSRECKARLLEQSFELLVEGGSFHQFTYAGRCPVSRDLLRGLGLKATRLGVAAFNFPPAVVYRFERAY